MTEHANVKTAVWHGKATTTDSNINTTVQMAGDSRGSTSVMENTMTTGSKMVYRYIPSLSGDSWFQSIDHVWSTIISVMYSWSDIVSDSVKLLCLSVLINITLQGDNAVNLTFDSLTMTRHIHQICFYHIFLFHICYYLLLFKFLKYFKIIFNNYLFLFYFLSLVANVLYDWYKHCTNGK